MSIDRDSSNSHQDFCTALLDLLNARTPELVKEKLLLHLARRNAAGVALMNYQVTNLKERGVDFLWFEDLSGELTREMRPQVARTMLNASPPWLNQWVFRRTKPFWLGSVSRFIPFSSSLLLRVSAPSGSRKLSDFLIIPFDDPPVRYALFIGLFARPNLDTANEIITLASTFLSAHVRAAGTPAMLLSNKELTPRQLECLSWIAAGKSLKQVADKTAMSYANVRYHLDRAKERTGLNSLQQLLAYAAIRYRLSPLDPGPIRDSAAGQVEDQVRVRGRT